MTLPVPIRQRAQFLMLAVGEERKNNNDLFHLRIEDAPQFAQGELQLPVVKMGRLW
jgi:hypothetical protein